MAALGGDELRQQRSTAVASMRRAIRDPNRLAYMDPATTSTGRGLRFSPAPLATPVSPSRRSMRRFAHGRLPRAACITATAVRKAEFKRSCNSEVGGCDELKAAVGTVRTGAITFTRTAARRGARGTDKILRMQIATGLSSEDAALECRSVSA